jgi:hypothetical protein
MSHCILGSGYCFGLWRKRGIESKSHLQNFFLLKLVTLAITDLKVSPIHCCVSQTLNTISAEKNSTIVFPLPIDLLTYFMRANEAASK